MSKTSMTNLKTLAALVIAYERIEQVYMTTILLHYMCTYANKNYKMSTDYRKKHVNKYLSCTSSIPKTIVLPCSFSVQ